MQYTYDCMKDVDDEHNQRLSTTTDFNQILPCDYEGNCYVKVTNNLTNKTVATINDQDDYDGWLESLQRAFTWKDKEDRLQKIYDEEKQLKKTTKDATLKMKMWDITEGSDIQMVNKKNESGNKKPSTNSVPPISILALGAAMQNGADKYGAFNWRDSEVTASVFYNAMQRHLLEWWSGENYAEDSKVHHLAHLMAGCAIILDAELSGVLKDDRNKQSLKSEIFKQNG